MWIYDVLLVDYIYTYRYSAFLYICNHDASLWCFNSDSKASLIEITSIFQSA
jgi:hypothetical protein